MNFRKRLELAHCAQEGACKNTCPKLNESNEKSNGSLPRKKSNDPVPPDLTNTNNLPIKKAINP